MKEITERVPLMAKPGIPVEEPIRRSVPEIIDPTMPERVRFPEPVTVPARPKEPVRVG